MYISCGSLLALLAQLAVKAAERTAKVAVIRMEELWSGWRNSDFVVDSRASYFGTVTSVVGFTNH